MWQSTVDPGRSQTPIWHMRITSWIPKAINTRAQYILLIAFPLQQWLRERASMLRYTYIDCIVITGMERVYCAVRNMSLNVIPINFSL